MPRSIFLLCLLAGCVLEPSYDSVRERLSDHSTRLYIDGDASTGTVLARQRTADAWREGSSELVIKGGQLEVYVDHSGVVLVQRFMVVVDTVDVSGVFKKPASLESVKLTSLPVQSPAAWTGDNNATVTLWPPLALDWSLAINNTLAPLATQHLPPLRAELALGGDGDRVEATLAVHGDGVLWNWADILQVTGLDLSLVAATVD
jgi:hypothetical protein